MSSVGYLSQISPYLLERFKAYPTLVDLYFHTYQLKAQIQSGAKPWLAIQELQDELAEIVDGWGEFHRLHPDDFEYIKSDIPLIFAESRFPSFQLGMRSAVGGGWESLHIFLAGTQDPNPSFLMHQDKESNFLFVNLIGGGQEIGNNVGYGRPRFFEPNEVQEINKALRVIDRDNFQERWRFICKVNSFTNSAMSDEDVEEFAAFFRELKKYIKGVVKECDALLFSVS